MKRFALLFWGLSVLFCVTAVCRADYTVKGNETYDSGKMSGTITINPGATLTGSLPATVSLAGSGTYVSTASGNVFYGTAPFNYSAFTGTVKLTTGRWMPQSYFGAALTMDVSDGAQVWIQSDKNVGWNFRLHDGNGMYDGLGLIRFDGRNSNITGNITLEGSTQICVRMDRNTVSDTVSGQISGSGALTFNVGSNLASTHGTLILTHENSYSGGTIIKEGTLELQGNGTLGSGSVQILRDTAQRDDNDTKAKFTADTGMLSINKSADYVLTNDVSGTGVLQKTGTGKLTFNSAASTFGGDFILRAGSVDFGTLSAINGQFHYYGGTFAGGSLSSGGFNLYAAMNYADLNTILANSVRVSDSGNITIGTGGVLSVSTATDLAAAMSKFTTSGTGTIRFTGTSFEINDGNSPYTFNNSLTISDAPGILNCVSETAVINVASAGHSVVFSQGISEYSAGQALIKRGDGTLALQSVSYTGKTTVEAGTLQILGNAKGSTSEYAVNSGAVLRVTEAVFEANPNITGTGTVAVKGGDSGEILDTTNPGKFTGTLQVTGKTRFRSYNLGNYSGVTFDISGGAQFWLGTDGNLGNNFILSGTGDTFMDGRGVFRFDFNAGNSTMPVVIGTVKLAGNSRISTIQADSSGRGMFAGVISGTGMLEKNEGFTIASNPLNARLILSAENTYSGGTSVVTGTLQLGYTGTMHGKTYDGTKGSLGTGALSVSAKGALDYNRVNTYTFAASVKNEGAVNVNSGTLALTGAITNSGNMNVKDGAVLTTSGTVTAAAGTVSNINVSGGGTYNARGGVSLGAAAAPLAKGIHNINLNGTAGKDAILNTSTILSNAVITGNENAVWNVYFSNKDDTTASIADASAFQGTINLVGNVDGSGNVQQTRWRPGASVTLDWSQAEKIVIGSKFELYMQNMSLTGNIELGNSTGYDSGAGIRIDGGGDNNILSGKLTLRDGETGIINLKKNAGNLRLNSAVAGGGNLTLLGVETAGGNVMTLTSNSIAYTGNTRISNSTFKLASGARMQGNGTITLADATAKFLAENGTVLAVGSDSATAGTTLTVTGAGTFDLNGTLSLNMFGAEDYDILDLTGMTGTKDLTGTVVELILDPGLDRSETYEVAWVKGFTPDISQLDVQLVGDGFLAQFLENGHILLGSTSALPEPATWLLLLSSLGMLAVMKMNARKRS